MSKLYEIFLRFIPYRLRRSEIWDETTYDLSGERKSGIPFLASYALREFESDLSALKNVWNGQEDPDSSKIILEDRDVDEFITGYLQPWISSDPHLLNIVLNVIQELKGTTKGLRLLAYILGVSEVQIYDSDSFAEGSSCPFPETIFHRYGFGGVYGSPSPDAELQSCYPGLRFTDGTWAYGSLSLFASDISTSYGSGGDYGGIYFYWRDCIRYGEGGLYGGDFPYCALSEYPHRCTNYGNVDNYGDPDILYCEACDRDPCIPNCLIVLRLVLEPTAFFDARGYEVFESIVRRYLPACIQLAALFWVAKLDDIAGVKEDLDIIDGDEATEGLVFGGSSSYGDGSGYGGFHVYSDVPVYGYPNTYGDGSNYGGSSGAGPGIGVM